MNYKIIKKIHDGYESNVYVVEMNNQNFIMKRYPIIDKNLKNFEMTVAKEIDMGQFVNNLPENKKKFFMKTINIKFVKCNEIFEQEYIKKTKTNKCIEIIFENKGNTIDHLKKISLKEKYKFILMIVYALSIIQKAGYVHADLHTSNITFQENKEIIKIGNNYIKPKYIYSIIDYGFNKHKKYKEKDSLVKEYLKMNYDLLYFIRQIILQNNNLQDLYKIKKLKRNHISNFKMENLMNIYKNHKSTWKKIKETLVKKGNNYKNWFDTFESNKIYKFYDNFDDKYPVLKSKGKNYINISIPLEINILFSAYNRKGWLKNNNWDKIYLPNFIPSKDIEFLILNITDYKKIIDYFSFAVQMKK